MDTLFENSYKIRVSARAVTISGDAILLNSFKNGEYYNIPGGGIEQYETGAQAVVREVWEETGLTVKPVEFLFCLEYEPRNAGYQIGNGHHISLFYRCELTGSPELTTPSLPDVDPDDPGSLSVPRWVPLSELPALNLLPHINQNLLEYLKTGDFQPRLIEEPYQR